jgi:RNA polymerase sigma-70 factor, ECF subfamily
MCRICADDADALDEILQLYWAPIVTYAARFLDGEDAAEDAAQHAFLELWRNRSEWQFTGSVLAYLHRVARNAALNERRRTSIRQRLGAVLRREPAARPARPDELAERGELQVAADLAIAALPERRREVFILVRFQGLSYREAADVLGISTQTVANHLSAALAQLRTSLADFTQPSTPSLKLVRSDPPVEAAEPASPETGSPPAAKVPLSG